ncbi:MAG: hypothetical protein HFI35_10445 [Roseburia sp.]|jgi:hypothetical protein|nr:hypothetical protein [Roseburia sp.]
MGATVNGAGSASSQSMMAGTLSIKTAKGIKNRVVAEKSSSKPKKRLNYNYRDISGQLIRAKKSQSAAMVTARAQSKLAVLSRSAASGQYSKKEIANAIAHARRMVRCAQQKTRNLREEEMEQRSHEKETSARDQQRRNEAKRRIAQKERKIECKIAAKEIQENSRNKRRRNEMMKKRLMHRSQERAKMNEADMKYIKGQMDRDDGEEHYSPLGDSAVLDLSMEAAALAEIQRLDQERQQIEAQIEAEIAAEIAMESGSDGSGSMASLPSQSTAAQSAPVEAASVDVAL